MSDCRRNLDDIKILLQSCRGFDSHQTIKFYNSWAETYDEDLEALKYRAHHLTRDFMNANISGNREEVRVLDVACGSGLVAKLMFGIGFRNFVGVDGSEGMLQQAAQTGLYQDLKLALLGTQPLPAQAGTFDVVIIVGALDVGFVPVRVIRELCHAARPGGFIFMGRGNIKRAQSEEYKRSLERELQLMEEEGLWSPVKIQQADGYMMDVHLSEETCISGTFYAYKKSEISH